jgi:hypothetical protein
MTSFSGNRRRRCFWAAVSCGAIGLAGCSSHGGTGMATGSSAGAATGSIASGGHEEGGSGSGSGAVSGGSEGIAEGGLVDDIGADASSEAPESGPDATTTDASIAGESEADAPLEGQAAEAAVDDSGGFLACPAMICAAGQKYCDYRCVAIDDPNWGCGTDCGPACSAAITENATSVLSVTCDSGTCAVGSCRAGLADCDGQVFNGCEADLAVPSSCGSCQNICAAGTLCDTGTCAATCTFPEVNCSGACRDLTSDLNACGGCGAVCVAQNAASTCANGQCQAVCPPGYSSCAGCASQGAGPVCSSCGLGDCEPPPACNCTETYASYCVGCTSMCFDGFTMCGSKCVDEGSDPANCGACGNSCAPGVCVAGQCTTLPAIQVATGPVNGLAVDSSNVYYTDSQDNTVWQVDKTTLAKIQLGSNQAKPLRIAVDGSYVYWTSNLGNAILRSPIGGSKVDVLYSTTGGPVGVAVDTANVYWSEPGAGMAGAVFAAPKAGRGTVRALGTDTSGVSMNFLGLNGAQDILQSATSLFGVGYWQTVFEGPIVVSLDKATGLFRALSGEISGQNVIGLAAEDARVYWFELINGPTAGGNRFPTIWSEPSGGGAMSSDPMPPTSEYLTGSSMIADGCHAYVVQDNVIYKITPGGSHPVPLVTAAVAPGEMVVDDTYLYWADQGWIGRAPK